MFPGRLHLQFLNLLVSLFTLLSLTIAGVWSKARQMEVLKGDMQASTLGGQSVTLAFQLPGPDQVYRRSYVSSSLGSIGIIFACLNAAGEQARFEAIRYQRKR